MIQVGGKVLQAKEKKKHAVFSPIFPNKAINVNVKLADPHLGRGELSRNMAFCAFCGGMYHTSTHAGLL